MDGNNGSEGQMRRDLAKKREDYISWEDYFMSIAFLSAMRSKDPCTQVGACIINADNKIVGTGYNGMPIGCSDDAFPWGKDSPDRLENKKLYVCHAEMNAILNKIVGELKGCRMYTAMFPCNECAKLIIQSGIRKVIFCSDKYQNKPSTKAAKRLFDAAGVSYSQYVPKQKEIVIDFGSINSNQGNSFSPAKRKRSSSSSNEPSQQN